jgi:fatty acid desaturase
MAAAQPLLESNDHAIPWPTRSRRSGRAEFTRIYLTSLTSSVEREVEAYRASRQRLRLAVAERRLRRLQRVAAARGLLSEEIGRQPPRVAFLAATVAVLCSAGLLVLSIATGGFAGTTLAIEELAALVLVVIWFVLAIACVPRTGEQAAAGERDPETVAPAQTSSGESLSPESSRLLEAWLQGME